MTETPNEISIDTDALLQSKSSLNKYSLLQSLDSGVRQQYEDVLQPVEGSLTTDTDNDAQTKFEVAKTMLVDNDAQCATLTLFQEKFKLVEDQIDPEKLKFQIGKSNEDEILIYRTSSNGLTNITIHEDGAIAFSFIGYKGSDKQDLFIFHETNQFDCESMVFKFFSL